jgi:hypothetical protein
MALTVILPSGLNNTGNFLVGSLSATGNLTGNYILGNGALLSGVITSVSNINSGTSNVTVVSSGGNVTVGVGGTSNVAVFATTGEYINGLLSVTGNITASGRLGFSAAGAFTGSGYEIAKDGANFLAFSGGSAGTRFINASTATEWARFDSTGNLSVAGTVIVNSAGNAIAIVNGATSGVGNIGASGNTFNTVFAKATTAQYADLAEMYTTDAEYTPGTVLVFGGTQEVTTSTETHDHRVAGVVSTNPAHLMNSELQGEHTVAVALVGRVPVSVIGNIYAGDQIVTSDRAGVAEALDITRYQPGVIIGKAVQGYTGDEIGVIEVVVGRL